MGTHASNFCRNEGLILTEVTDPSQANWIVLHAETCKMTVPEVQRCWSRFLMLQPNQKGNLPRTHFLQTNTPFGQKKRRGEQKLNKKKNLRTFLQQIPVTDDDQITFQTFCNAASWLFKSSLETKLRGLYQILAPGNISKKQLRDLFHELYPKESRRAVNELSSLFLKAVDKNNQGYISEDVFVAWVQNLPQEMVQSILNFPIISPNLTLSKSQISHLSTAAEVEDKQGFNKRQLSEVAMEISAKKRNWKLLASKLGISEEGCFRLEHEHLETVDQILKMLQMWYRMCQEAPLPRLQAALRESGNVDICNKVFHLSF
ncbi:uncharacterized protein LOC129334945 [Eublepharis macularius]|uniref:Uncharacterized protein LOC129334945 n=1 Tax=Eublepharis macularius TaxID=481883 RepID=A0AA97JUC3_EUBMA|nr:uncharacterized protein LOC129334945 [Eublepharis macularius]